MVNLQITVLDFSATFSVDQLVDVSGLSIEETALLIDAGVFVPVDPVAESPMFHLHYVAIANTARRLRDDFELDGHGLALVYGALLAHGMGLDRVQVARMMPGVPESQLRVMMQLLQEDGRLSEASSAVMQFMRRHPIVSHWGESGLASADMMTVESSRRLWNSRVDPRTGNYAIGTYTHVLD